MRAQSRWRWALPLVIVPGSFFGAPASGQDNRVPTVGEEESPAWRFIFTPDFWASGLSGRVGVGSSVSNVDLSFGDIFDDFDISLRALFEARRTPWVFRGDLLYMSLGDEQALSDDGTATLRVTQEQFVLQPEAGYTFFRRPWGGVDALVGVRYWHLSVDLDAPPQQLSGDKGWVDGTVGAAFRYQAPERWRLFAKADAGAGGSDFTWQGNAGAGYDLGHCCTVIGGYRYLSVDYEETDGLVYDVNLSGPLVGVSLRF